VTTRILVVACSEHLERLDPRLKGGWHAFKNARLTDQALNPEVEYVFLPMGASGEPSEYLPTIVRSKWDTIFLVTHESCFGDIEIRNQNAYWARRFVGWLVGKNTRVSWQHVLAAGAYEMQRPFFNNWCERGLNWSIRTIQSLYWWYWLHR
jgi:hypothetical protein